MSLHVSSVNEMHVQLKKVAGSAEGLTVQRYLHLFFVSYYSS
jgi:hypothetical protein